MKPFFAEPIGELHLGQAESQTAFDACIVAQGSDSCEARLPGVRFRVVRVGTEEVALDNSGQDVPWAFGITLNRATKRVNVTARIHGGSRNVKREAEAAHFLGCLSRGGTLSVVNEETGLALCRVSVPRDLLEAPPAVWLTFIDSLLFLQQCCDVAVALPEDAITSEDAEDVVELAERIRAGIWEGRAPTATLTVKEGALPNFLPHINSDGGTRIVVVREEWFEVFGAKLPLGTAVHVLTHMAVAEESRAAMANHPVDQPFEMKLVAGDERSRAWLAYLKWLSPAQLDELQNRLPGVALTLPNQPGTGQVNVSFATQRW